MSTRSESGKRDDFEARALGRVQETTEHLDASVFAATFDLLRVANRLMQDFETHVHRPLGLSWAGFRVLFCVWVENEVEPAELARLCAVSRATVSSVLNTLERDGMIGRERATHDGRAVTVGLTDKGRRRVKRAFAQQHTREQLWLSETDREATEQLVTVLRGLLARPKPE